MLARGWAWGIAGSIAAAACGAAPPPDPEPPPAAATAAPTADAPYPFQPATEAAPAAAITHGTSRWHLGAGAGTSLSAASAADLLLACQRAGWATQATHGNTSVGGPYESISVDVAKGSSKGIAEIVRPAAEPNPRTTPLTSPTDLNAQWGKRNGTFLYDKEADLFFSIELDHGSVAEAKRLLAAVAKRGK